MQVTEYADGEFCWHDQASDDDGRAAEFYTALFGWECPPGRPEFGNYRSCLLNGKMVAGLGRNMEPGPTVWSTYVKVTDASATAEKVREAGGQVIVEPMAIGEFGTMAIFADPTGAVVGAWQPDSHGGAEVRNEPGAVCWYELITSDVDAAAAFYEAVFGWRAQGHGPEDAAGGYREFKLGDKTIGGLMAKPPSMPAEAPPFWGVYFAVADVDGTVSRVEELGGRVIVAPRDIAPGRFATVTDATGAAFNLLASSR